MEVTPPLGTTTVGGETVPALARFEELSRLVVDEVVVVADADAVAVSASSSRSRFRTSLVVAVVAVVDEG
jgi:hypothetical protein